MLFTSYGFIGFLMVLFVLYYLIPRKYQWKLLLLASCLFYIISGPTGFIYLLLTAATTWYAGIRIGKNADIERNYIKGHRAKLSKEEKSVWRAEQKKRRFRWLLFCILVNFGVLLLVKYVEFLLFPAKNILVFNGWAGKFSFFSLVQPMGISFYTLQAMGYLVDVYRGDIPEKNFFRFTLFVAFFPQLIQGPISRYDDLAKSLYEEHSFDGRTVSFGLQRILWGYFKKLVIADRISMGVAAIAGDPEKYCSMYVFVGMLFYTLELYADFTGGIDITIGIAETMGISVRENFCRPYFSCSLKEYWRRWHISMSSWFRDYVFIRFLSVSQ